MSSHTVTLVMTDDDTKRLAASRECAARCRVLAAALELATTPDAEVPVPNVSARVMARVLRFAALLQKWPEIREGAPLHDREREFDDALGDVQTRKDVFEAATFLDFPRLVESQSRLFAERIARCDSVEEVRAVLGVENDFAPGEEEELRAALAFAF